MVAYHLGLLMKLMLALLLLGFAWLPLTKLYIPKDMKVRLGLLASIVRRECLSKRNDVREV